MNVVRPEANNCGKRRNLKVEKPELEKLSAIVTHLQARNTYAAIQIQ